MKKEKKGLDLSKIKYKEAGKAGIVGYVILFFLGTTQLWLLGLGMVSYVYGKWIRKEGAA